MFKKTQAVQMLTFLLALIAFLIRPTMAETIVVYGASGKIGGLIVNVALEQGHTVIGVSRNPDRLSVDSSDFSAVKGDVTDPASIKAITADADAVIISVTGAGEGNKPANSLEARSAMAMVNTFSGDDSAPRVIVIGGATTMYGSAEAMKDNLPFPAPEGSPMHGMLYGHMVALETYQASSIPWTVVTPPLEILGWAPGGLTDADTSKEHYRTSTTEFVRDAEGHSTIYVRDLARAAVDEVTNEKFINQRFTVGY